MKGFEDGVRVLESGPGIRSQEFGSQREGVQVKGLVEGARV